MTTPGAARLDADGVTAAFWIAEGPPECLHWGAPLAPNEDLAALRDALAPSAGGAELDLAGPLSLSPEARRGWLGAPGLVLRGADGAALHPRFETASATVGSTSLDWTGRDDALGLTLRLSIAIGSDTGVLRMRARLASERDDVVLIERFSTPVLPAPSGNAEILDFGGRWCREFQPQRSPWRVGAHRRDVEEGRTSHGGFPGLATVSSSGEAALWSLGWSGGHVAIAEELPDGRRHVQFASAGPERLASGAAIETPEALAAWSANGLDGAQDRLHRDLRARTLRFPDPARPRPVHYNCWEAVYFDHDQETLFDIASRAAALGAERFVLDDGWFIGRTDDTRALGDWEVDLNRYPAGLAPLIEHVEALGMRFGLWVEPEMVNTDSALHRAHPDWVLGGPAAEQPSGRAQFVLDLANPEVFTHLLERLDALLAAHRIDYLKWDHNRPLLGAAPAQARAFYALLDALRERHPGVEIESCASGGGRIDYGVLERCQRVWLSDSNDAIERARMQNDALLFLPPEITGSHVGPRVCHTSGRALPIAFRAWVAATRHFGFELDPRELTAEEAATLQRVTRWWTETRDWTFRGPRRRVDAGDAARRAELAIAEDGARFALFVAQIAASDRTNPKPLRLAGLAPEARFRLRLVNGEDVAGRAPSRGPRAPIETETLTLSGAALAAAGLRVPSSFPATMWVIEGVRDAIGA